MNIKRNNIALLGVIGLLVLSIVAYDNPADAVSDPEPTVPRLVAAESLFEFGHVLEGTEVVHDFLIENHGTDDLRIDEVRTG